MAPVPPAPAETVGGSQQGELIRLLRAPHKALRAPPVSHESSTGQRKLVTSRKLTFPDSLPLLNYISQLTCFLVPYRPKPKNIIYTHSSVPLFLPLDYGALVSPAIPPNKKRIREDDEEPLQPAKKKRSARLVTDSMDASRVVESTAPRKSRLSPYFSN